MHKEVHENDKTYKTSNREINCQTSESTQLQHLATHGEPLPVVVPKMINQSEAVDMLGISLSNFKKLEAEGAFPFKRRMVGSAVRYRNTDVLRYMFMDEAE